MLRLFPILILAVYFFSSCTFEQDYYFKKDNSGTMQMKIDFSKMMAMFPDSVKNKKVEESIPMDKLDSLKNELGEFQGFKNIKMDISSEFIGFSMDFDNLETLNNYQRNNKEMSSNTVLFQNKGKKKFLIDLNPIKDQEKESSDSSGVDTQMIESFLQYKITVGFERKIKSFKSDVGTFDPESNTIIYKMAYKDLINTNKDLKTRVKLK